jgi:hypothetical protein
VHGEENATRDARRLPRPELPLPVPADLLASWAFEMEALILSWYVMVHTG